jgi:hypothetical protein
MAVSHFQPLNDTNDDMSAAQKENVLTVTDDKHWETINIKEKPTVLMFWAKWYGGVYKGTNPASICNLHLLISRESTRN